MGVELVQPRLEWDDGLRAQPEQARPGVVGQALVNHDSELQQHAQVAAHRRRRHPGRVRELSGAPRPRTEELHDRTSGGIRQRHEQRCDLLVELGVETHDRYLTQA